MDEDLCDQRRTVSQFLEVVELDDTKKPRIVSVCRTALPHSYQQSLQIILSNSMERDVASNVYATRLANVTLGDVLKAAISIHHI